VGLVPGCKPRAVPVPPLPPHEGLIGEDAACAANFAEGTEQQAEEIEAMAEAVDVPVVWEGGWHPLLQASGR
jgi:hypothetical protein